MEPMVCMLWGWQADHNHAKVNRRNSVGIHNMAISVDLRVIQTLHICSALIRCKYATPNDHTTAARSFKPTAPSHTSHSKPLSMCLGAFCLGSAFSHHQARPALEPDVAAMDRDHRVSRCAVHHSDCPLQPQLVPKHFWKYR